MFPVQHRLVALLVFFNLSTRAQEESRQLQLPGANCDAVLADLRTPKYNLCSCGSSGGSGGGSVNATCNGCPKVCGLGSCGSGSISRTLEFESDGSIVGQHEECFEYVATVDGNGASGKICKQRDIDSSTCSVFINGTMCSSCEMKTCDGVTDSTKKEYFVDCSNIEGGEIFNFCEPVNVADNSTAFVWLDSRFEDENPVCRGGGSSAYGSSFLLSSFAVYWLTIILG